MRKFFLAAVLVLMASGAQASSYLDIFGVVRDPIFSYVNFDYGVHYSGPDLQPGVVAPGAFLEGAFLGSANLTGANLSGANLYHASLTGADLSGANLSFAYLDYSRFSSANLSGADLSGVNSLFSTYFNGANLSNMDLSGVYMVFSTLNGANLSNADLSGAHLGDSDESEAAVDLTGANLTGADLSGTKLMYVTTLDLTVGIPNYDALTDFTNSGFDPVAAGWNLVPEPSTALLLGLGLVGIAARRRPATAR